MGRAVGWWGLGGRVPCGFGGASLCWGRSVTTHTHRSVGIPQVRWVHLARQYIALPRPWLPLRMESSGPRLTKLIHKYQDVLEHCPHPCLVRKSSRWTSNSNQSLKGL